jgi:anti-sigma B factor antagonist
MDDVAEFRLTTLRLGEHGSSITVEGELDLYSAPKLKAQLLGLADDVKHVLVDLSRTTFVDSAGLGVLVACARRLRSRGGTILLAVDDLNILKVLEITGLARFFEIRRSVANPTRELLGLSLLTSLGADAPPHAA